MSIIPSLVSGSGIPINKHGIIGVSPGGPVAPLQISQENYDDVISFSKTGSDAYGYKFRTDHLLIGKTVTSVWFLMSAGYGEITSGTISCYAGSDTTTASNNTVIGTFDPSTLSTSESTWSEFTGTNEYEVQVNDTIWIQTSSTMDQRADTRYYANAAGGYTPEPPNDFWGAGGSLPSGNTEGTTDAGDTYSAYGINLAVPSKIGLVPPIDGDTTGHPMAIKIYYTE